MYSIICLKQQYLQHVVGSQTVYIPMITRKIRLRFFKTWIGFNIPMREQYQRAEKIIERSVLLVVVFFLNNTSYFGKAIRVIIHKNWMGAIMEDSNTCMPLKYINRHQVCKLKSLLNTKKKNFMKISLLQQIKTGMLSSNTFKSSLKIILYNCL